MPGKNFKNKQKAAGIDRKISKKVEEKKVTKSGPKFTEDEIFRKDVPGMILLVVLYMF